MSDPDIRFRSCMRERGCLVFRHPVTDGLNGEDAALAGKTAEKGKAKSSGKSRKKKDPAPSSRRRNIIGLVVSALSVFLMTALATFHPTDPPRGTSDIIHNAAGAVGAWLAYMIAEFTFGRFATFAIPLSLLMLGIDLLRGAGYRLTLRLAGSLLGAGWLSAGIWELVRAMQGHDEDWFFTGALGGGLTRHFVLPSLGVAGTI
ncbi:hypothetical protein GF324_14505, partial [bacterium]|nr:hypothetical protein [bacterium]